MVWPGLLSRTVAEDKCRKAMLIKVTMSGFMEAGKKQVLLYVYQTITTIIYFLLK